MSKTRVLFRGVGTPVDDEHDGQDTPDHPGTRHIRRALAIRPLVAAASVRGIIDVVNIRDISAPLREDLPAWPGEEGMTRTVVSAQPDDPATVSHLAFGAHTGTHIDAPIHFLPGGGGIETVSADSLVGPCFVADLRHVTDLITGDDLVGAGVSQDAVRLLALTRNSGWSRDDTEFRRDYVAYDLSAAEWCVEHGIRLVGNDYLSIETFQADGYPVHKTLLGAGLAVLEGVDLDGVSPGVYDVAALPILVPGADGAPVRAVLIES